VTKANWTPGFAALCVGQFLAHQTALSFSALIPILTPEWHLSGSQAGLILGVFQLGTLCAYVAVGFLLDRIPSKPIMAWSAALVGLGDILFAVGAREFVSGFALRLLVGVLIGGLYLPALKYVADAIPGTRRGLVTGIYIGAIVMAHAAPLFYIGVLAPRIGWRATMTGIGVLELLGALVLAWRVPRLPLPPMMGPSDLSRYVGDVLKNRPARRVIVAYTAHNWELFGMWGWVAPFMVASLTARGILRGDALAWGGLIAAGIVGLGGSIGAVTGGRLSDRLGRAWAATVMLALSLVCSLAFGWMFAAPLALLIAVGVVYGIVVLADSPSYSATLMEVVPARSLGGAFSLQMLVGWAATAAGPAVFGAVLDLGRAAGAGPAVQWGSAFGLLALAPLIGVIALRPLRDRNSAGA
jgi:MFS family permease